MPQRASGKCGLECWPLNSQPSVLDYMESIGVEGFVKWILHFLPPRNCISRQWTTEPAVKEWNGVLTVPAYMVGEGDWTACKGSPSVHPSPLASSRATAHLAQDTEQFHEWPDCAALRLSLPAQPPEEAQGFPSAAMASWLRESLSFWSSRPGLFW